MRLSTLLYNARWYPWLVAVLCMLIVATSNGMINSGLSVFDESLLKEFRWSVTELKLRDSITFLGASVLIMGAGLLLDRFGFKPLLLLGMLLLAGSYYSYSYIVNLQQAYLLHLVFALVAACAGNMAAIITAATWVQHRQGLAIGMAIAGTSVGGIFLPPFANYLNQNLGWRDSMRLEAIIPLVMFVAILLLIGNRKKRAGPQYAKDKSRQGTPFNQVLKNKKFYLVAAAGACTYYVILALFSHLFLFMRSLDYSPAQASFALTTLSFAALTGKILSGWLADVIDAYKLLKIQMTLMLLSLIGISQLPVWIWGFLLLAGFSWGSLHTLYNYILIALFGLRAAGKIHGSVTMAEAAGGSGGIFMTGLLHDAWGGYSAAFLAILAVMGVGVLFIFLLRPGEAYNDKATAA